VFIRGYNRRVKFEFFDHTADLGAHIHGATREELFQNAAAALYHAIGEFQLKPARSTQYIKLKSNSMEELLVEFTGELLFRFDAHRLMFDQIEIQELSPHYLAAKLSGAEVDLARSQPNYEIKAVTYHQTKIEPHNSGWRATLIFDV
jgi:SHS2 domain-containing protein